MSEGIYDRIRTYNGYFSIRVPDSIKYLSFDNTGQDHIEQYRRHKQVESNTRETVFQTRKRIKNTSIYQAS